MNNGFRIQLRSAEVMELEFRGVIGTPGLFGEEDDYVRPAEVLRAINSQKMGTLRMFVNSPGGDVYDGFQIFNRLQKLKADGSIGRIEMIGEGLVASAATLVFLAGDERTMMSGSRFMIHRPQSGGFGNEDDFRKIADKMAQTMEEALDLYEAHSAMTRDELREDMIAETYYTPAEAEAAGFATATAASDFQIAACMSDSLRHRWHKKLPESMKVLPPSEQAKAIIEKQLADHPDNWQHVTS